MVMLMPVSMPVLPARGAPVSGEGAGFGREKVRGMERRGRRRERESMVAVRSFGMEEGGVACCANVYWEG